MFHGVRWPFPESQEGHLYFATPWGGKVLSETGAMDWPQAIANHVQRGDEMFVCGRCGMSLQEIGMAIALGGLGGATCLPRDRIVRAIGGSTLRTWGATVYDVLPWIVVRDSAMPYVNMLLDELVSTMIEYRGVGVIIGPEQARFVDIPFS